MYPARSSIMASRRIAVFLVIFGLGILLGWTLVGMTTAHAVAAPEAQRRALQILDQRPATMGIGTNPIVSAVKKIAPAVVNIDTVGPVKPDEQSIGTVYIDQEVHGKGSGVIDRKST